MRIALVVDNPFRDLPGIVLLAANLASRGADCYLVPVNLQLREIAALAPDFVLLNYFRPNNEDLILALASAGIGLGVLDTEGGVFTDLDLFHKSLAPSAAAADAIRIYCAWGKDVANTLLERRRFRADQVCVTGAPRFDFYGAPWREAAVTLSPASRFRARPLILFNANFALGNPGFNTQEGEREILIKWFGYSPAMAKRFQEADLRALHALCALAGRQAIRHPDVDFVVRPHPFERLDTYRPLLVPQANLHLLREGAVDGWILQARAVVQRNCTTAIEAALAGIPSLSPVWINPSEEQRVEASERVSTKCDDLDQFDRTLDAVLQGTFRVEAGQADNLAQIARSWFCAVDGRANRRVADAVEDAIQRHPPQTSVKRCRELLYYSCPAPRPAQRLLAAARRHLGLSPHWSFRRWRDQGPGIARWDASNKQFDFETVRQIISRLAQADPTVVHPSLQVRPPAGGATYRYPLAHGRAVVITLSN